MTTIYYLHKGDNTPVYVGKTITTLKERLSKHYSDRDKSYCIAAIDEVDDAEYGYWEKFYIELFTSWGFELENKNKGGGGTIKHTEETKHKLSIAISNHPTRGNKISLSTKGKSKPKHQQWCNSLKKPILQFNKDGLFIKEWTSAKDAAMYYGNTTNSCQIQNALKQRRQKTAYGFIWKYKDNETK